MSTPCPQRTIKALCRVRPLHLGMRESCRLEEPFMETKR